ncbi:MAG: hypothetical protein DRN04_14120 [Thermoprotei archaeon]|nr:MAG: hypothetical protein DRN04_14120 [Thermoprotei archaeon]
MIPKSIKREHILEALNEIDKTGIPDKRASRKYNLEYRGKFYPVKLVISKAYKYVAGEELAPSRFDALEAVRYLKKLGFNVIEVPITHRGKYLAIVSTIREWMEKAPREDGVFHFPPNRKPKVSVLAPKDKCLIYLYDEEIFAGELVIKEAKEVTAQEFHQKYAHKAVEISGAPFPKGNDKIRIILYSKLIEYPIPLPKNLVPDIGPLGVFRLLKWENKGKALYETITKKIEQGHNELKEIIAKLGETLNFIAKKEYSDMQGLYRYDVVWLEAEELPPVKVFEIQKEASVDIALARLSHAYDIWRPQLYLIVTKEKDLKRAQKLVNPYLAGAFHRIKNKLIIITAYDVIKLWHNIKSYQKLLQQLAAK